MMPFKALRLRSGSGIAPTTPLSPFYPTSLWGCRLRRLAYTGPAIRVKNATTAVQTDIPFGSGGYIDEAAVNAASGGTATLWVKTVYAQDGSSPDLTDSGSPDKLAIATAGVVWKVAGKPALRCDLTLDSSLNIAADAAFAFGTGAFTWEVIWQPTGSTSGLAQALLDFRDGGSSTAVLYNKAGDIPSLFDGSNNDGNTSIVVNNTTVHQAVSYVGGASSTMSIWHAGTLAYSASKSLSFSGNRPLSVCEAYNGTLAATGLLLEVRITRGSCEYTSPFTPPDFFA